MSNSNVTKEGIAVKPGQVWKDLDKRTNGGKRTVTVDRVVDGGAFVTTNGVTKSNGKPYASRLSIRRMHKGATGWALVSDVE
jgi:hypothetical protein